LKKKFFASSTQLINTTTSTHDFHTSTATTGEQRTTVAVA